TMLVDGDLAPVVRMDGVVTVVDAVNGPATMDAQFEAVSQVAMADMIVLSKTDLAKDVAGFEARLRSLNTTAPIVHAVMGEGLGGKIWGLSGLRADVNQAQALQWMTLQAPTPDPLANLSGFSAPSPQAAPISAHDTRIGTASIVLDDPLDDKVFDNWLNTLISLRGEDILRVKGIVFLKDIDVPFVFHGVQHIFDPPLPVKNWQGEDRRTRIVVIARDLSRPELQASLNTLRGRFVAPDETVLTGQTPVD
ncbi:MAG: GTP-binding protein, partial [Pseudomonadota bacterium]